MIHRNLSPSSLLLNFICTVVLSLNVPSPLDSLTVEPEIMRQTLYEKVYYHFVKTTLRLGNKNICIHEFFLDSMCEGMKIQYLPFISGPNWSPRLNLKYTLALAGLIRSADKKISFHLKTGNNYNQTMTGQYM